MEFAANFMTGNLDPRAWARQREDEGWDVIGCADHFFSPRRAYPHLWVTLATVAAATRRVTLTPLFANNLLRSPVEFAQASLEMQLVSDGRFEAGLGAGWTRDEIEGAGIEYPPPADRASRYAEAMQIVRELFDRGSCRFVGRHYEVDIPVIGPRPTTPPPLVGALGGPRTIREVGPLVDRIEINIGSPATRGGVLDLDILATIPKSRLVELLARVRDVNPTVPVGLFVLCSIGEDDATRDYENRLAGSFHGEFFGEPKRVADALHGLADLGIDRVQISPFTETSFEELAPFLGGS
jgi:alkanesulfonate monooxygenase SsuD/methylene tetrahydromethanopterin reductase-like flavin-dependent oxidoreductase (luciferase family)